MDKAKLALLRPKFEERFPCSVDEMLCHANDCATDEPCVWDYNKPDDCCFASKGIKKEDCPQWRKCTFHYEYDPKDIWEWLEIELC